ncbi:MAG TPA: SCP2 sterol-binding domain-containing protein [Caldilineaceae bacterium]|nr:SCP2 sterol-binding domain-containing protein [Caldilineaceae bacterium]
MPVFSSEEQLYTVLQSVFERLNANPKHIASFTRSNLVIRLNFTDPTAEVLLDGRQPPLEVFYGPRPGKANMEFTMPADLLHRIWLGEESTSQAFFSGRIKTKGNFMKALQLLDLFREAERVYPAVAAEHRLI